MSLGYNQSQPTQSSVHSTVRGQLLQGQAPGRGLLLVDAVCWRGGVHKDHGLKHNIKNAFGNLHVGIFDHNPDKTPSYVLSQNTNDDNHFTFHLNVKHNENSEIFYESVFIYERVEM